MIISRSMYKKRVLPDIGKSACFLFAVIVSVAVCLQYASIQYFAPLVPGLVETTSHRKIQVFVFENAARKLTFDITESDNNRPVGFVDFDLVEETWHLHGMPIGIDVTNAPVYSRCIVRVSGTRMLDSNDQERLRDMLKHQVIEIDRVGKVEIREGTLVQDAFVLNTVHTIDLARTMLRESRVFTAHVACFAFGNIVVVAVIMRKSVQAYRRAVGNKCWNCGYPCNRASALCSECGEDCKYL
jgi:hypothetical protein